MARYTSIQNSFASGALSEKMVARTDLTTYNNSVAILENMEITPEGGVSKRSGLDIAGEFNLVDQLTMPLWDISNHSSKRVCYSIDFTTTSGVNYVIVFFRLQTSENYKSFVAVYERVGTSLVATSHALNAKSFSGFPTDHLQVGDIIFVTFDFEPPQCLFFKNGEMKITPYAYFSNTTNSYLGSPVDGTRSDLSVYLHYTTTPAGTSILTAGNSVDPLTMFPYPLFEVDESFPTKRVIGGIAFHQTGLITDYVSQTTWLTFDTKKDASTSIGLTFSGHISTAYNTGEIKLEPINTGGLPLPASGLKGFKVSYTARDTGGGNEVSGGGYLAGEIGPDPSGDYTYYIYREWADAANPTGKTPVLFTTQDDISVTIQGVASVQVYNEGPISLANNSITNVFYEGMFGSKYGNPTCVNFVSGRLAFSGVKGKAGVVFLSDHRNLFRLNPFKLRQDDPAFYKVNTKASDVSKLNFFGDKIGAYPDYSFIGSSGIENIYWIESIGEVSIVGTDKGEIAFTAKTLDEEISYSSYTISSYGSDSNKAITVANSIYFVDKFGQLIQITQEGQSIKAGNISALNITIIPTGINKLVFSQKKQILYIIPYAATSIIGYSVSRLTGVSGFFKSIFSFGPTSTSKIEGAEIVDNKLLLINSTTTIGESLKFYTEGHSFIDLVVNKFKAKLVTLPIDQGNPYGSSQGIINRLHSIIIKLYRSGHCMFGSTEADLEVAQIEAGTEFTGQLKVNFPASPDTQAVVQIESEENAPLTVLGIVYQGEGYE